MGVYKVDSIRIGTGGTNDFTTDVQIFSGNADPVNGAAQPGVYPIGKDGDIYLRQSGATSTMFIKANNTWRDVGGQPLLINLLTNQAAPANVITFDSNTIPYIEIDYTVKRGSDATRRMKGKFIILADPAGNIQYSSELDELGATLGVALTVTVVANTVSIKYTSTNEVGVIPIFQYNFRGWK